MNKKILVIAVALLASSTFSVLVSRSFRPGQIPNGSKNNCANCHVNPGGGGARNPFGQTVEANFLDGSGNVTWGAALAKLDSDGDGFTNGQELQDPEGQWKIGDPAPGDRSLVTKPGDPTDFPTTTAVEPIGSVAAVFDLQQNYPNPFNPATTIRFDLPEAAQVRLDVYDATGELVRTLADGSYAAGSYSAMWDGRNMSRQSVESGAYFYRITAGENVFTRRMLLVK